MFRSYLKAALFLCLLLIFGGCAKNPLPQVETAVAETAREPVTVLPESEQAVPPSIEGLIMKEEKRLETVLFEYDSYALTASAQQVLKSNAAWLVENSEAKITIGGHCDERGSDEYNLALGERRALAAKYYFVEQGITPERLAIISYGEEVPVSAGHDETAWQQNRRVEFNQ